MIEDYEYAIEVTMRRQTLVIDQVPACVREHDLVGDVVDRALNLFT